MSGQKDDCDCGHDRSHHYFDPVNGEHCNCLAMRCECKRFVLPGTAGPKLPARPRHHPAWCKCFYCKQHPESEETTDDEIDEDPPVTPRTAPRFPGAVWP